MSKKAKFQWAAGSRTYGADPEKVARELQHLRTHDGILDIDRVVTWAKEHPKSELHTMLEWDNAIASHHWRMHQVRMIVTSLRHVEVHGGHVTLKRENFAVGGGQYAGSEAVEADEDLQALVLQRALKSLQGWTSRYEEILQMCGGAKAAKALLKALEKAAA